MPWLDASKGGPLIMISIFSSYLLLLFRVWWKGQPGRLLRHLYFTGRAMETRFLALRSRIRYTKATLLQAVVRGFYMRRKYALHVLARRIQRCYHRYKRALSWSAIRFCNLKLFAIKVAEDMVLQAAVNASHHLVARYVLALKGPRSLLLHWRTRRIKRQKERQLLRVQLAVRCIQRFWRTQQSTLKASIFRVSGAQMSANPFNSIDNFSELLRAINQETRKFYSIIDPRCGMTIALLLRRLYLDELLDMFKVSKLTMVLELNKCTLQTLTQLHENWQGRVEKDNLLRGNTVTKKIPPPLESLALIVSIVKPKYYPWAKLARENVSKLDNIVESLGLEEAVEFIRNEFQRKFGKALATKASNVATQVTMEALERTTNFSCLGGVLSVGCIPTIIRSSAKTTSVKEKLVGMIHKESLNAEELKRARLRCRSCLKTLEFGIQQALRILYAGPCLRIVYESALNISIFKKRFRYLYYPRPTMQNKSGAVITSFLLRSGLVLPSATFSLKKEINGPLALHTSSLRIYTGPLDCRDLELTTGLCKLHLFALERLFIADCGLRVFQCRYRFLVYKSIVKAARLHLFLQSERLSYLRSRRTNRVKSTWDTLRRVETVAKSMQTILSEKLQERYRILERLKLLPRFGCVPFYDAAGVQYWSDGIITSSYEMPSYNLREYKAVQTLQTYFRKCHTRLLLFYERQREALSAIIKAEAVKMEAYTLKSITASLLIDANSDLRRDPKRELEQQTSKLPRSICFDDNFTVRPRMWLLLHTLKGNSYQTVMVIRIKTLRDARVCDLRTLQDEIMTDIPLKRLHKLHLDIGSAVEARFRGSTLFYRGTVMSVRKAKTGEDEVNIRYEDGDFEARVPLHLVRQSQSEVDRLMKRRREALVLDAQRLKREACYATLKQQRYDTANQDREEGERRGGCRVSISVRYTQKTPLFGWDFIHEKNHQGGETIPFFNAALNMKSSRPKYYAPQVLSFLHVSCFCPIQFFFMLWNHRTVRRC